MDAIDGTFSFNGFAEKFEAGTLTEADVQAASAYIAEIEIAAYFAVIATALIDGPSAWMTPDQIAAAIDLENGLVLDALVELDARGLVSAWPDHDPPVVTLTALGAKRAGVRLVETGSIELYRWSRDSASARPRKPPSRRKIRLQEEHDRLINAVPDPHDDLDQLERELDRHERRHRARSGPPRPTLLLIGGALIPWEEDGFLTTVLGTPCPTCRGDALPVLAYCLRCSRWGWQESRNRKKRASSEDQAAHHEETRGAAANDRAAEATIPQEPGNCDS
jgi:hypothetical protein